MHVETEKERYAKYLCSPEWWAKRNAVIDRSGGRCEQCFYRDATHVHHLTYARKYNEELTDLKALCHECHDAIHKAKHEPPSKPRDLSSLWQKKQTLLTKAKSLGDDYFERVNKAFSDAEPNLGKESNWFFEARLIQIVRDIQ
jgi:hypothetical protein